MIPKHAAAESEAFKLAASFLPKHKIDAVANFADRNNLYAVLYRPLSDEWIFHDGELFNTKTILEANYHAL